jgi:hypothetical protein
MLLLFLRAQGQRPIVNTITPSLEGEGEKQVPARRNHLPQCHSTLPLLRPRIPRAEPRSAPTQHPSRTAAYPADCAEREFELPVCATRISRLEREVRKSRLQ